MNATGELLTLGEICQRDRNAIEDVRERLLAEYPGALGILREYDFVICPRADYRPYERQSREAAVHEERRQAARKAAEQAAAIPYGGGIGQCQIGVIDATGFGHHRCNGKARYVRRIERDSAGDGRIAVCAVHRTDPKYGRSFRYVTHSNSWQARYGDRAAVEAVEPEYQP